MITSFIKRTMFKWWYKTILFAFRNNRSRPIRFFIVTESLIEPVIGWFLVTEAPRGTYLLIDGRRLDPGNQFVPVKEGSELTLECAAEGGNPPPVLAWGMTLSQATLDGPEQPPDNLTVLPSTSGRRSGAHLKVLRGHHNATIVCVARHITLMIPMNASILLDVQCEYLSIVWNHIVVYW